jgi:hypothetical protein
MVAKIKWEAKNGSRVVKNGSQNQMGSQKW